MEKVTIIILNWNGAKDTIECIESLKALTYPNYEILLIDNGSTDDSVKILSNIQYSHLHFFSIERNLGFAEGNNFGIRLAKERGCDYIFLLNNDTVVHPEILEAFLEAAHDHKEAGVFGGKIYYYDEPTLICYAGGEVSLPAAKCVHIGYEESDLEKKREEIRPTQYACGCSFFIRANILDEVGLLEPKFFLLWEETDWCFRIQKAGYSCLFVPKARVWHKVSSSFIEGHGGAMYRYFYWRNRLLFLERNLSKKDLIKLYRQTLLKEIFRVIRIACTPNHPDRDLQKAALRGIRDYFFRHFGAGSLKSLIQ